MKNITTVVCSTLGLLLGFLALLPVAQAAPPPKGEDRGNGNSAAENVQALNLGTTGSNNTAHGWFSLFSNTTGSSNTADGFQALYSNTTGTHNTANGYQALFVNTTGFANTANGSLALRSNTTGGTNTANGAVALYSNTTGNYNTATGFAALQFNATGDSDTANGFQALSSNITGASNTAVGTNALSSNVGGSENTALGAGALASNTGSNWNTAIGWGALASSTAPSNTAVGWGALASNTTGSQQTAIGVEALHNNISGHDNIALGSDAGAGVTTASSVICIGAEGANVSGTAWINNVYGVTTQSGTTAPVIVSETGQLGTISSSQRFKKDIATMEKASEAILSLRPVTFHYKADTKGTAQFGLIAEEVAKVNLALVLPDKEGKPYTVRYDAVNAMLLNEFLKEHKTVQELKKEIAALTATVKEQESEIRKVSTQVQRNALAPQMVSNR